MSLSLAMPAHLYEFGVSMEHTAQGELSEMWDDI